MALVPQTLADALYAAETAAQPGPLSPEAQALLRSRSNAIAQAVHAYLLTADVQTTVNTTAPPGVAVVVAFPAGTGTTVAPVQSTGVGTGKLV